MANYPNIEPGELAGQLAKQGDQWFLVDVRSPGEFRGGHIAGAKNHPVDQFDREAAKALAAEANGRKVCLICQSARRSKKALDEWAAAGLNGGAVELGGGMNGWKGATEKEPGGAISLFRQVQIVAGLFVFVGTLLGAFVDPWLLLIPGFFGAGLLFAGISGTCGMGVMLSKMPWNR